MHNDANVSHGEHQKPEIIIFYNDTKGGVDQALHYRDIEKRAGSRIPVSRPFFNTEISVLRRLIPEFSVLA